MSLEEPARIARELASHGYAADREAITLLAGAEDVAGALALAVEATPDDTLKLTAEDVREALGNRPRARRDPISGSDSSARPADPPASADGSREQDPSVSGGTESERVRDGSASSPVETEGSQADRAGVDTGGSTAARTAAQTADRTVERSLRSLEIGNDMTGYSTGTGEYDDFVATFRDRYDRLAGKLKGRVNHRNATALQASPGGGDAGIVGMVSDIRSTASGHWLIELEDTTGVFPCLVMKDKAIAGLVEELLFDEVIAVDGTLSDDGGILFVDDLYFPDVPRTYEPSTADRHVKAALISDVHVGSQEFMADAWNRFTSWLHTEEAERIEYLLIAGDMVEGVGVYPDQDEELDIVDIFDQYRQFSEYLKEVPGDLEIVMIPGNHDAVRLAEPQPGFDDELRSIMTAHDARIVSNPTVVTIEGVSVLMYHGVSLDEVIAELPEEKANYDEPHKAMYQLLKKRHVAPQFGGHTRLAPEEKDYLVMDEVPDIFHTGHVHKLGWGKYRNVVAVNSGCWQAQTDFQKSVNIDPDAGFAPVVDLDTLDMTVHKFS
ncbi:MAG: DNA-directed DNA polymerase II small subunit [Natronomonas sp.]|uniref:DNA-directed DNA polymerase II small subunit n=1 Tax=Natronomonas sp. TaxID=2184060 RepID=UPI0028709D94|nr:DNA-directed DNA polymerase II small subunit [Natronomonas sp.]MDR9429202.1 DNA-directed DNA polymerase II small subunit [Natronomonas sp.]